MVKLYKYYTDTTALEETAEASSKRHHPLSPHHSASPSAATLIRKNSDATSTNHDPAVIPPPPPLQGIKEESAKIDSQVSDTSLSKGNSILDKSSAEKPKFPQKSRNSVSNLLSGDEEESKVGAAMSDITTKRVIVLVLVMLICIPLMTFTPTDLSSSFGTSLFHEMVKSSLVSPDAAGQVTTLLFSSCSSTLADWGDTHSHPSGKGQQTLVPGV